MNVVASAPEGLEQYLAEEISNLGGLNINADNIQANVFGDDTQNAYGTRTVNTGGPSGGSNGDIHYKI